MNKRHQMFHLRAAADTARAAAMLATIALEEALPIGTRVSVAGKFDGIVKHHLDGEWWRVNVLPDDAEIAALAGWKHPDRYGCHLVPIESIAIA